MIQLLKLSRGQLEFFAGIQHRLVKGLCADAALRERVERLLSIRSVGEVLALTWAWEIGAVQWFPSIAEAVSYCGLTSAQRQSADKRATGTDLQAAERYLLTILIRGRQTGLGWNCWTGALARLGIARANELEAKNAKAPKPMPCGVGL